MKRKNNKIYAVMLVLICVFMMLSTSAFAAGSLDTAKPVSLTVNFRYGETAVPNAQIFLYRVADMDNSATFTPSGDFAGYAGKINGLETADEWDALAADMVKYADKNSIEPDFVAITDKAGAAKFPEAGKSMMPGLYLLVCNETWFNNGTYTARPCLVALPTLAEDSGAWQYDVSVNVKSGHTPEPTPVPTPTPTPEPHLPQTGVLWWPVPVLLAVGLLFVILGVYVRSKKAQ